MQEVCGTQRMHPAHVHRAKNGTIYNVADQDENDPSCAVQWDEIYLWWLYCIPETGSDIHSQVIYISWTLCHHSNKIDSCVVLNFPLLVLIQYSQWTSQLGVSQEKYFCVILAKWNIHSHQYSLHQHPWALPTQSLEITVLREKNWTFL